MDPAGENMTETLTNWANLATETRNERRHQPRANVKCPIEVCGFSKHGRYFTERTFTTDVSDGGCRLHLRNEVDKASVVAIRVITGMHGQESEARPVLFHVNWFQALPTTWTLGVSKLQAGATWCASMPQDEKLSETVA
jgi:hypothetical protein